MHDFLLSKKRTSLKMWESLKMLGASASERITSRNKIVVIFHNAINFTSTLQIVIEAPDWEYLYLHKENEV